MLSSGKQPGGRWPGCRKTERKFVHMIRFVVILVEVVIFAILSLPILLVEWIIGKFNPRLQSVSSFKIVRFEVKIIIWLAGTRVTVIGKEKVPTDKSVLYICNHRSYLDILLTYSLCHAPTGYIAKKEIRKIPILSIWMKFCHCLFLDRDDIRQGMETILKAIEYIKEGISVCIYPEGTRNTNESEVELLPFHEGSFRVSTRSGAPIIPVSISNSREIFESHFPRVKACHVILEYGDPIDPNQYDRMQQKHLGELTRQIIHDTLEKNQKLIDSAPDL